MLTWLVEAGERAPRSSRALAAGALAVVWVGTTALYAGAFRANGADRWDDFHAGIPALIESELAEDGRVVVPEDDIVARNQVLWHLTATREGRDRMTVLPRRETPPVGELVFGSTDECPFDCTRAESSDRFWLAEIEA